ncbi:RagB/SusD family nutrient uptake outer membrane protein [Flammeovirga sp. EKP202]|uniref:RagB/SusD family nutrient uptake outer membrane protein n=1 Tax=Flammeovirga sp. EKP202 TaxID=2770592 RepID=UPI00165EC279|nr:RagB/SusD family nutrient uptake outer membrane protein [Flammeovirga sp. EKP202]MBD0400551.1 RagB/SusD family nutrient uptake outer membrane protein [Flammeovirga sp. EKP202]
MKLKKYIVAAGIALGTMSCNAFLDVQPISEETTDNAYNKASQIESALVGVYETFQSAEYYVWDHVIFSDIRSDNAYAGGDNPEVFEADLLTITPINSRLFKNWSQIYNGILKANTVIEKAELVDDPKMTEERKAEIKGEALFLRAYYYFTLVKLHGGVPLILEPTKSTQPEDVRVPRNTVDEVYQQIITDLTDAANFLPDFYTDENGNDLGGSTNKARATAGAANALLAKVYAQHHEWDNALVAIDKVEKSAAAYTLLSNYAHLFDGEHYNNAESIIEVQYLGTDEGNFAPQLLLPPSISGDSWRKFVTPSQDLIAAYDAEGDATRKGASVLFEEVNWVDEYWGNSTGSSIPFSYKWKKAMGWASTDRPYLIRFGDIVLLKAEALNETGQSGAAVIELNKIRSRANLEAVSGGLSKEELRTKILLERRLELAQEGHRWDDLVRHNIAVSTMNNLVEIDLRTGQAVDYNMTEAKMLLPIPQQELDLNPELEQNPL